MKKFFNFLMVLFIFFMVIGFLAQNLDLENIEIEEYDSEMTYEDEEDPDNSDYNEEEITNEALQEVSLDNLTENETLLPCASRQSYVLHKANWKDYNQKSHRANVIVKKDIACVAYQKREKLPTPYYDGYNAAPYWGEVYNRLHNGDSQKLNELYEEFAERAKKRQITGRDFTEMVVTFIQSIPYVLVHEGTCEQDRQWGGFSVTYHDEGKECLPNIRYGLQSPAEFMYNLKGDCDTRSVLAYTILSHFGYDVVVLGCETHAMLGINIPARGDYVRYKGKKYYFWETTATGWQIGQVPPDYKQYNWGVYLPSENDL